MRLVSPNEMHEAAKNMMLDGHDPVTDRDWGLIVNFYAANTAPEVAESAVPLMCLLMDCPLEQDLVLKITRFQIQRATTPQ